MSQAFAEIRHFWKCLGNCGISGIAQAIGENPGISGNA